MSGRLYQAYCQGGASSLYGGHFADRADRQRAVSSAPRIQSSVVDVLAKQNARWGTSAARDANLAALRAGAAAAVSGQQVGLFLGPLFTLYKAAGAVRLAEALTAECGRKVVPVFWLQSEDHDLAEIAECWMPAATGEPLRLQLPVDEQRVSLAHLELPADITGTLARLRQELGTLPYVSEHLTHLQRHYRPGTRWVDAFAQLLSELFAEDGLILIEARDSQLAEHATEIHRRALIGADEISAALQHRSTDIAGQIGEHPQVHVRPGSPLSFFHPDGPEGARFRLEPIAHGWSEVGGRRSYSAATVLALLDQQPMCFSTSVLLRPILQDTLLPTAAYVGGPAEVAYFAQLAPLYPLFGISMPLVVPRPSLRLIEPASRRQLERFRLQAGELQRGEDELLQRTEEPADRGSAIAERLCAAFDAALAEVGPTLERAGEGLDSAVAKTRATVELAAHKLATKYDHAVLHRDAQRVAALRRLRQALFPNGSPQERVFGLPHFAARFGERALIDQVRAAIDIFDPAPRDVLLT